MLKTCKLQIVVSTKKGWDEELQGYLIGFAAAFCYGFHAVAVRYLADSVPGITIGFLRLFIASCFIFFFLRISGQKMDWKIPHKKWFVWIVLGLALNFLVFHLGLGYTSASSAMLLESTSPIFVLIFLAIFLKEKFRKRDLFIVLLAIMGVVIILFEKNSFSFFQIGQLWGNFLELVAALTFSIFIIGSSKVFSQTKDTATRLKDLLKVSLGAAVLLSPSLFLWDFHLSYQEFWLLVLLGIVPTALGNYLWFEAAARLPTLSFALLFNLSVVFTFINADWILHEQITLNKIIGAVLVLAAITMSKVRKKETV